MDTAAPTVRLLGRLDLINQIRRWAELRPAAVAVTDATGGALTYGQLWSAVGGDVRRLSDLGVRPNDRVGLAVRADAASVVTMLAAVVAGAIPLLYDARATPAEISALTAQADVPLLVQPSVPDKSAWTPPPRPAVGADWIMMATSGTNGSPKIVAKHWSAVVDNSVRFGGMAGYQEDDRVLCTTPLHHAYAFGVGVVPTLYAGAAIVLAPHPLVPSAFGTLLGRTGATVVQSVPFLYREALRGLHAFGTDGRLRLAVSAGEPLPAEIRAAWQSAAGAPLCDQYGATELGQIAFAVPGTPPGSCTLVPGVRARTRDANGWTGGEGEIFVSVPGAPCRYPGQPELEARSFDDGWFRTGDWGVVDPAGFVTVTGRVGRRVVIAGRKVDPVEVEQAIRALPGVLDCVVGTDEEHGYLGFVVAGDDHTELSLRRALAADLSAYKIPRRLVLVPELPRTRSGKVRMGSLWATAAHARDAGRTKKETP